MGTLCSKITADISEMAPSHAGERCMREMSAGSECSYDKLSTHRFIIYQVPMQQMGQF